MDQAARRYGTRPSTLLSVRDDVQALAIDVALAERARLSVWDDVHTRASANGDPDWQVSLLLLVMQLI